MEDGRSGGRGRRGERRSTGVEEGDRRREGVRE